MKKISTILLLLLVVSCSSDDKNCTKTIEIPQVYIFNNQTYSYNTTQEVACDFPEPQNAITIEPPVLEGFTYEVLSFVYTPDTGNDTSRLQFEIKLINNSTESVSGYPVFTLLNDNIQFSTNYANIITPPCNSLNANSSCIVTLDVEENHILGYPNSVELLNVEYYLTN